MVTMRQSRQRERGAALLVELIVAMVILTTALMPIALSIMKDQRASRNYYFKAIAMEIVDGEMEVLRSGYWKEFQQGAQPYPTTAEAAQNLPEGDFILTLKGKLIRLEWKIKEGRYRYYRVHVVREVNIQ